MDRKLQPKNINEAFESGTFAKTPDDKLQEWLIFLNTEPNSNREVIQALSIQHLQMKRYISKLNNWNTVLQVIIIVLAFLAVAVGVVQIYTTLKYSRSQPESQIGRSISQGASATSKTQSEVTKEDQTKTPSKPLTKKTP